MVMAGRMALACFTLAALAQLSTAVERDSSRKNNLRVDGGHAIKQGVMRSLPDTYLPKQQLRRITSIECLRRRQKHPKASCNDLTNPSLDDEEEKGEFTGSNWHIGNYPRYNSTVCHGHGDYLCDPDNVLTEGQRGSIALALQQLRESTVVSCPLPDLKPEGVRGTNHEDKMAFKLGVSVAEVLPSSELDARALDIFGTARLVDWGMEESDGGLPNERDRQPPLCRTTAMIILVNGAQKAHVASPSCDFVCDGNGGNEVSYAMEQRLAQPAHGPYDAIMLGITQFRKVLVRNIKKGQEERERLASKVDWEDELLRQQAGWNFMQRSVFFGMLGACLLCVLGTCHYALHGWVWKQYNSMWDAYPWGSK